MRRLTVTSVVSHASSRQELMCDVRGSTQTRYDENLLGATYRFHHFHVLGQAQTLNSSNEGAGTSNVAAHHVSDH